MAAVNTASLGEFAGLNNRLRPTDLVRGNGQGGTTTFLERADNTDLDEDRHLVRRPGRTLAMPGPSHSLWADEFGAVAVINGTLVALDEKLKQTPLRAGMPDTRVAYSRGPDGALYWTNTTALRKVVAGTDRPVLTPAPSLPSISVGAGGLLAGRYLVMITADGPAGESAPSGVQVVTVPAGGAVQVAATLQPGQAMNVYMSGANGDVLTFVGASSTGQLSVASQLGDGRVMEPGMAPMSPGQLIAHFDGRLVVAADNVVWFSRPWHYGLTDPVSDYIPLPGRVTLLAASPAGLFIAADQTWHLPKYGGDIRQIFPFGAVEGAVGTNPEDGSVFWHSERGLVLTNLGGEATLAQNDALTFEPARYGASLWRERNGSRHILSSTAGAEVAAVRSTMLFEVKD